MIYWAIEQKLKINELTYFPLFCDKCLQNFLPQTFAVDDC
jgi:hypothetical protein